MNEKTDFRLEQIKNSCKFPPIPKGKLGEEYVKKNSLHNKLNDLEILYKLEANLKNSQLNRTVEGGVFNSNKNAAMKLKQKHARKNSILAKIAETANLSTLLARQPRGIDIKSVLKINVDRPKATLLQDTLQGVLQTNAELKEEQRKYQRFQHWGGIKVPINSNINFNRHKDKINKWDESRDGIFYNL